MTDKIIIRPAGISDINTIHTLAHQVWPLTYAHILSADQLQYMLDLIYSPASLEKQFAQQHRFLLVVLNEAPVGFASFSAGKKMYTYKLQKIYVRTDIQGKGLGKMLIDVVVKEAKANNATSLLLNVNRHNKAISFYEKMGFSIIAEEDIDIGSGYLMNDYVMEKKL